MASTDLIGSSFGLTALEVAVWIISGLLLVIGVIEFFRWKSGAVLSLDLLRVGAAFLAALVGCAVFDLWVAYERGLERRALEVRAFELMTRATAPGSALGCLNAITGEDIETACEKALFGTPDAAASAVSYVAAQLALLSAGSSHGRLDTRYANILEPLRRAVETDRFGIVAHVLAMRHACTPTQCAALSLLREHGRVKANLADRTFDSRIKRHAAAWSEESTAIATNGPPGERATGAPVSVVRDPSTLFFPSSSSIPAVSIMTAEPGPTSTSAGTASSASAEARQTRKSSQPQRPSVDAGAMSLAPPTPAPGR